MSTTPPGWEPPPSWRTGRGLLLVRLGIVLVVGGAGGAFVVLAQSDGSEKNSALRQEYVDAIAAKGNGLDDLIVLDEAESRCLAEAEIDVIGLDALQDHVTPAEIRDVSYFAVRDFGMVPTYEQGLEMVDSLERCTDDLAAAFTAGLTESNPFPVAVPSDAGQCLAAGFESQPVRDLYAATFGASGDDDMTEDQAATTYDWMFGCVDPRPMMVEVVARDTDPEIAACLFAALPDDWVRRATIDQLTGAEDGVSDDLLAEITPVIADCTSGVRG